MNIHHLELFYYVARFGGISEAVRNIPYGIQQPAVSGQILQLEEFLGVTLFQRRPLALTPQGRELFDFIKPFFSELGNVADRLRGGGVQQLRIGASEVVLRDHLPAALQVLRGQFPKLKVALREGYEPQLASWLAAQELDVAVTLLDARPGAGIRQTPLLQLPLILVVEKRSKIKSAEELWAQDRISEQLISLPTNQTINKNFQQGLARLGVDWFTAIEVGTLELVETYVANGYGVGLSVQRPNAPLRSGLRAIPLPAETFSPVTIGVISQGRPTPLIQAFEQICLRAAATVKANSETR
jgi:DNA-binding transcriptional LysR family regulator